MQNPDAKSRRGNAASCLLRCHTPATSGASSIPEASRLTHCCLLEYWIARLNRAITSNGCLAASLRGIETAMVNRRFIFHRRIATQDVFATGTMHRSASAPQISALEASNSRHGKDSADRSERAASLAFKAFMSMDRAVAIVGPDGKTASAQSGLRQIVRQLGAARSHQSRCRRQQRQERLPDHSFRWPRVLGRDDTDGWRLAGQRLRHERAVGQGAQRHPHQARQPFDVPRTADGAAGESRPCGRRREAILVLDLARFKADQ